MDVAVEIARLSDILVRMPSIRDTSRYSVSRYSTNQQHFSNQISTVEQSKASAFTVVFCGISFDWPFDQYSIYCMDLMRITERHGLLPHLLSDDTQVCGRCSLSGMDDITARVSACTDEILNVMR